MRGIRTGNKKLAKAHKTDKLLTTPPAPERVLFLMEMARVEQGNYEVIKTVRWTVLVPACVSASAEASRATAISTSTRKGAFFDTTLYYIKSRRKFSSAVRKILLTPITPRAEFCNKTTRNLCHKSIIKRPLLVHNNAGRFLLYI